MNAGRVKAERMKEPANVRALTAAQVVCEACGEPVRRQDTVPPNTVPRDAVLA